MAAGFCHLDFVEVAHSDGGDREEEQYPVLDRKQQRLWPVQSGKKCAASCQNRTLVVKLTVSHVIYRMKCPEGSATASDTCLGRF